MTIKKKTTYREKDADIILFEKLYCSQHKAKPDRNGVISCSKRPKCKFLRKDGLCSEWEAYLTQYNNKRGK